jgi:hypothetical protein
MSLIHKTVPEGGERVIHLGEILQDAEGRWWQYVGKDAPGALHFASRAEWGPGSPDPRVKAST